MIVLPVPRDLIVLTADKSARLVIRAVLSRWAELGCRAITVDDTDLIVHVERDPGLRLRSQEFLRPFCRRYAHALAVLDHLGSGYETRTREQVEERIENALRVNGWEDRAAAIAIGPELENWMWGDWGATAAAINWTGDGASLRLWLTQQGQFQPQHLKPSDPKGALERAATQASKRWSSSIHASIATHARIDGCTDPAFLKLLSVLQRWFPVGG